jgi:hypothetical protein
MKDTKALKYAEIRVNLLKPEMGSIINTYQKNGYLFISFENGMTLQLHQDEIKHQAIEYLQSEIQGIINN